MSETSTAPDQTLTDQSSTHRSSTDQSATDQSLTDKVGEVADVADSFVLACSVTDLPAVGGFTVEIGGEKIAIVRDSAGDIHAVDDTCSHENVSLSEGEVEDGEIECWLHGSRFDLRSGKPTGLPATRPIAVYPVKINGDDVFVSVTKEN